MIYTTRRLILGSWRWAIHLLGTRFKKIALKTSSVFGSGCWLRGKTMVYCAKSIEYSYLKYHKFNNLMYF